MHRMSVRSIVSVLLVSCCAVLATATGTALATTLTYSADNSTLIVTGGDDAAHDIQFRLVQIGPDQYDDIIDTAGISSYPGNCGTVAEHTGIRCPGHVSVQVDLGAGNDAVSFVSQGYDCFATYAIALGDGANTLNLSDNCPPSEVGTVTSGSGPDTLRGGSQGAIAFTAGGGNDNVSGSFGDDVIHGDTGDDRLFGGGGNDRVYGDDGSDTPNGGDGNDLLDGGAGNDDLGLCRSCPLTSNDTGAGADTYTGGTGTDTLWLDNHAGGMAISLDGVANDGAGGEGDNVGQDIESIVGTAGNDVYVGRAGPDVFSGYGGNDEIHGGGGPDDLYGSGGDDKVFGDAGDDKVQGGGGDDTVDGGPGLDTMYGDISGCSVFCTFDADTLLARDGERDTVDCGGGADTAQVDAVDVVAFCASVDRASAPVVAPPNGGVTPPPAPTPTPTPTPVVVAPSFRTLGTLSVARGLTLVVTCPGPCSYTLSVILDARTAKRYGLGRRSVTVARRTGSLLTAGKKTTKLTLTATARRKLRRATSVPATIRLSVKNAAGKVTVKTRRVTLRR